jgi:hypothetical protein
VGRVVPATTGFGRGVDECICRHLCVTPVRRDLSVCVPGLAGVITISSGELQRMRRGVSIGLGVGSVRVSSSSMSGWSSWLAGFALMRQAGRSAGVFSFVSGNASLHVPRLPRCCFYRCRCAAHAHFLLLALLLALFLLSSELTSRPRVAAAVAAAAAASAAANPVYNAAGALIGTMSGDGGSPLSCVSGWSGAACDQDLDECSTGNGGCVQRCVNTEGR